MSSDGYYTEQVHGPHEYLDLGNFELASGFVLPGARLAYKTMGTLSGAKDNAVLLPHMYTGTAAFMQAYVGPGRPLDPDRYFLILPAQFGDGFSSSPSNTPPPFDRGAFPPVAISDDVRAQHRLVTEVSRHQPARPGQRLVHGRSADPGVGCPLPGRRRPGAAVRRHLPEPRSLHDLL